MSKKYLSLDEAAQLLHIPTEELVRLREKGEIRGFADRGTWKFKQDDVESLFRRLQADSNPEVPIFGRPGSDLGEQPTVIRRDKPASDDNLLAEDQPPSIDSDSDVRLVGDQDFELGFGADSDSDVKLSGGHVPRSSEQGTDPEIPLLSSGSDSDVKLIRPDSDSDVKLAASDSGSDVKLAPSDSDSDVRLLSDETEMMAMLDEIDLSDNNTSDSDIPLKSSKKEDSDIKLPGDDSPTIADVTLLGDDDAVALDFDPDTGHHASVLDDESGISLGGDSSLLLGESGISLAGPSDSGIALDLRDDDDGEGITLALDDESGISLDAGESGISLESADSGISLEPLDSGTSFDDNRGTVPMMDIMEDDADETHFEIPSLGDEDDDADATRVMDVQGGHDDEFSLDEQIDDTSTFEGEDLDLESEAFEEDQDLDVFDAGEESFEGAADEGFAPAGVGRLPAAEVEWGTATFVGLSLASVLLILCGVVMIDLVKHTATANNVNPVSGKLIELFGGMYKS